VAGKAQLTPRLPPLTTDLHGPKWDQVIMLVSKWTNGTGTKEVHTSIACASLLDVLHLQNARMKWLIGECFRPLLGGIL